MILPVNKPLSEQSINFGIGYAKRAGYNITILQNAIDEMLEIQKAV